MTRRAVSVYMASTCAILISSPGRFAFGFLIALELFFLTIFGTLFRSLLKIFKIRELKSTSMCVFIVFLTMIFKFLITIWVPSLALQLSFVLYLPSISTFTTVFLFDEKNLSLKEELSNNLVPTSIFALYILFFQFFRDILCYGTITFPGNGKLIEKVIFSSEHVSFFTFFATIPGVLALSSIFLAVYLMIEKKLRIAESLEG